VIEYDHSNYPFDEARLQTARRFRAFIEAETGSGQLLSAKVIGFAIGLSLALGVAEAGAAQADPPGVLIQAVSNSTHPIQDLGDLPPPPDSDGTAPASASASTVSSAEPIPELPIWAMLLLCFAGLGLARFKRGRKGRLSPGIE
jgi:hypothetical protein